LPLALFAEYYRKRAFRVSGRGAREGSPSQFTGAIAFLSAPSSLLSEFLSPALPLFGRALFPTQFVAAETCEGWGVGTDSVVVGCRPPVRSCREGGKERAGEAISVSPPSATPSHRPTGDTIPLARYCTKLQTGKILQTLTVRLECGARLLPAANPHLHLVHHSWQTDMRRLVSHHKTCGLNYKKF
jgi:hypothetical protein